MSPMQSGRAHLGRLVVLALLGAAGCKDSNTADKVKPCAKTTAATAGEGVKTGGKTAVEGVKTFGKSVGGLFSGGTDEAKKEWKEGSKKTGDTAKGGGADTKQDAKAIDCD
jgi:hypothetical protein